MSFFKAYDMRGTYGVDFDLDVGRGRTRIRCDRKGVLKLELVREEIQMHSGVPSYTAHVVRPVSIGLFPAYAPGQSGSQSGQRRRPDEFPAFHDDVLFVSTNIREILLSLYSCKSK